MYLNEFIENKKSEIQLAINQLVTEHGRTAVLAGLALQYGLATKPDYREALRTALTEVPPAVAEAISNSFQKMEKETGKGLFIEAVCEHLSLFETNKNLSKSSGSYDGTDKGEIAESAQWDEFHHIEGSFSPVSEELRREVLSNASPEAVEFFHGGDYDPVKVVDSSKLSQKVWNEMRRCSIGCSEIAAVLGTSPFQNKLSLFGVKTGSPELVPDDPKELERKEIIFGWGHDSETPIKKRVPFLEEFKDCQVLVDTAVYSIEDAPWLTCNLDGILVWPDGHRSVLEFKAPGPYTFEAYEDGNIPEYYEDQMQMQMALLNLDDAYLVAMFNRDKFTVSHTVRDMDREMEAILETKDFWFTNIVSMLEPKANGTGATIDAAITKYHGHSNAKKPSIQLDKAFAPTLAKIEELNNQRLALDKESRKLKAEVENLEGPLMGQLDTAQYGTCKDDVSGFIYKVKYTESHTSERLSADGLRNLKQTAPDLYADLKPFLSAPGVGKRKMTISSEMV